MRESILGICSKMFVRYFLTFIFPHFSKPQINAFNEYCYLLFFIEMNE